VQRLGDRLEIEAICTQAVQPDDARIGGKWGLQ